MLQLENASKTPSKFYLHLFVQITKKKQLNNVSFVFIDKISNVSLKCNQLLTSVWISTENNLQFKRNQKTLKLKFNLNLSIHSLQLNAYFNGRRVLVKSYSNLSSVKQT